MEIPIFDRVSQINYRVSELAEVDLAKEEVAQLHELQHVSVTKRGGTLVNDLDVKASENVVPFCRLGKVQKNGNRITVEVRPGAPFACSSK